MLISADQIDAICTVNRYSDGRAAEVFIEAGKAGSQIDLTCRDAAVSLSLLYQYGVPAAEIARSLARLDDGRPATILGAAADRADESDEVK